MKGLRIGRRRTRADQASPLELALRPALVDGRWQVPDRFNFARDVVEALAGDPKRTAVTILGRDGVIEPRTFLEIAEAAGRRAATLAEHGVHPKDRVVVMAEMSMHWLEVVLGIWKAGAIAVPVLPSLPAPALEALHASVGASLVVAEPAGRPAIGQMSFEPDVLYVEDEPRRKAAMTATFEPSHDTSSRDLALVFISPGTGGAPKEVGHTHAAVYATRMQAEHWLDAGRGDVVWCTAAADSPLAAWFTLAGPWSRGAETVIHQGEFDAQERLEHLYRIGPTILCQSAGEYRALAAHDKLERFRPPRLRRLVSTGDVLDPEVVEAFQERWGLAIHDGFGQAETNVLVGDGRDAMWRPGSIGRTLPGYEIAIVDDQGNDLPNGVEGDLAVRGNPPTLFAGYWEAPEDTKRAYRGDLYLTGDVAVLDDEGFFRYVARAEDVITSSGRTFGPYEVEHVLRSHAAIAASAVVGIRDLQRGGQFVRAYVVPVAGTSGTEQLEAELRQFLGQVLPEQQVPREIVFVEELPVVRGRLSRAVLRDRPLAGRPLWELPPTSEPDAAAPAPVRTPVAEPPVAEAAPVLEPQREHVVVPSVSVEPLVDEVVVVPEPVASEPVAREPEPEPEPVQPEPEPVQPEPVRPEPEPVALKPEPATEPEPPPVEPVVPAVAEVIAPEPLAVPEPEPEPVPEPAPEPVAEVVPASEPVPAPESRDEVVHEPEPEAEPERKPELRIVRPAETAPDIATPPLPGSTDALAPEPSPREPLPDYVVAPDPSAERPVAPPPPPPEPEPEPDLGPLPDYIVDPNRPAPPRPEAAPREAAQAPRPAQPKTGAEDEVSGAEAAGIYFPPVTSFPSPREDDDEDPRPETRKAPRRRPAAEPAKSKSRRSQEEPGDEAAEPSWMAGLSNRLSAYSLAKDGEAEDATEADEAPAEEGTPPSEKAS